MDDAIEALQYGTVVVNGWGGLGFACEVTLLLCSVRRSTIPWMCTRLFLLLAGSGQPVRQRNGRMQPLCCAVSFDGCLPRKSHSKHGLPTC